MIMDYADGPDQELAHVRLLHAVLVLFRIQQLSQSGISEVKCKRRKRDLEIHELVKGIQVAPVLQLLPLQPDAAVVVLELLQEVHRVQNLNWLSFVSPDQRVRRLQASSLGPS